MILHCDCNSFFASVETVLNPKYKGVPMAVCGSQEDRHGIVLAKNELAKKYGIQTAETVFSAKKKCPNLVIAEPHYAEYSRFSCRVSEIYARYTDIIEPFGIDESWLDVTASRGLFGTGYEIAEKISRDVKTEIGITLSIGVSFNKVFAKLGSDYKKPDAITVIDEENFQKIIYPLPVSDLLFVGRKTAAVLAAMGIRTIGELAESSPQMLTMRLGKAGELLHKYARGEDDSPVSPVREDAKSVSNGFTFRHDLVGREECRVGIDFLCEEIGTRLRKKGLKCSTVQLTVKDEYLRTTQRQKPQEPPTDISSEIADTAFELLCREWSETRPIRTITVAATNLVKGDFAQQISLFDNGIDDKREKKKNAEKAVDKIRQKYGFDSIIKGAVIDSDIGIYTARDKKTDDDF